MNNYSATARTPCTFLLPLPCVPHSDGDDDDDDAEDVSSGSLVSALSGGGPPGVSHGLRSRQNCGDVSSGLPVWPPQHPSFSEQISRMSRARRWFWGAAKEISRPPFALRLRGCLGRFACFRPQHPSFSEQISRMSRARRWFAHPRGPRLRGCLERFACFGGQHLPLSEQIFRMSCARRWFSHPRGPRL